MGAGASRDSLEILAQRLAGHGIAVADTGLLTPMPPEARPLPAACHRTFPHPSLPFPSSPMNPIASSRTLLLASAAAVAALFPSLSQRQAMSSCQPAWVGAFGGQPGLLGTVRDFLVFDDGTGGGPELFVGGSLLSAGGWAVNNVAKWGIGGWQVIEGSFGSIAAMTAFDDGSGPALIAATLQGTVSKWTGATWLPLGSFNGPVNALAVFDDRLGGGPALYAGGTFTSAQGQTIYRLAKWDGRSWLPVGLGFNGTIWSLEVFDDGSGGPPLLIAAGEFSYADGVPVNRIAAFDGTSWTPLGGGISGGASSVVRTLAVFDDGAGSGPALYAGGQFTTAGAIAASNVARWNGQAWSAVGGGTSGLVATLESMPKGLFETPALVAGGAFVSAGGVTVNRIARWNGASWAAFGTGSTSQVNAVACFDDGTGRGASLYAGGTFVSNGVTTDGIGRWDGAWHALDHGLNGIVRAVAYLDDGSGTEPALFVGGSFTSAGGTISNRVAKWNGSAWEQLGAGFSGPVHALAVFDDGSGTGPAIFAAVNYQWPGASVNKICKWDGAGWLPLPNPEFGLPTVRAMVVYDDGSGPALCVGGEWNATWGQAIAKWDGTTWTPVGGVNSTVESLVVHDDGAGEGPALYAGGWFAQAGGLPASRIARWNGKSWSTLGAGVGGVSGSHVRALAVHDDGSGGGPALYVGGKFSMAGGQPASHVARWDGSSWSALGAGVNLEVWSLQSFDDGTGLGPQLYAGGPFTSAGGTPVAGLARWGDGTWSGLDGQIAHGIYQTAVRTMTTRSGVGRKGPTLILGGDFLSSPAGDSFLAQWRGCPRPEGVLGDLNGDGLVDGADLGLLLAAWGECEGCLADLNADGMVDGADLGIQLANWQ